MICGKVSILGTEYEITVMSEEQDPKLKDNYGYCDPSVKQIIVSNFSDLIESNDSWADLDEFRNKVIRHEIIHAMMYESGLSDQCEFAMNEELIDWIAIQFDKMKEIFKQAECAQGEES